MKELFDKYYKRLAHEAMLKAAVCGILVGFAVDFVLALVTWFAVGSFKLWFVVALGAGVLVGIIFAFIMYFAKFRPNPKAVARRLDSMGLEERLITMMEFENDNSYIATIQREDAKSKLHRIDAKSIKFSVAKGLIIATAIVAAFGLSMTTVNALAANTNLFPSGSDLGGEDNTINEFSVTYEVYGGEGGEILCVDESEIGDFQIVNRGENTKMVYAEPEEGWVFYQWREYLGVDEKGLSVYKDLGDTPERMEVNVQHDILIIAVFVESESGEGEETPDPDEEADESDETEDDPEEQDPNAPPNKDMPQDGYDINVDNRFRDGNSDYAPMYPEYSDAMSDELQNPNNSSRRNDIGSRYRDSLTPSDNFG